MKTPAAPDWQVTREAPTLDAGEIHIWRVALDLAPARVTDLRALLSTDELDRADRFHFEVDRSRFIVAHAALRTLLARYLDSNGYRDAFHLGANGKPALGPDAALRINLAHSKDLGLIALAKGREIGVDLEAIDRDVEVESIAERFFSPQERSALFDLPRDKWREGFFHLWCQKEAYLKGRGDGVIFGLDHFDVVADPDLPPRLLSDRRNPDASDRWRLYSCDPGPAFRGAVAVEGTAAVLRFFQWS